MKKTLSLHRLSSTNRFTLSLAGSVLLLAGSSSALTLTPVADTYVQISSTANNSAATQMLVKNQNNNANERISFLRFDGSGLTGGNVDTAALDLKIVSFSNKANMTLQLFGILDGGFNETFDATTLTYTNSSYTTAAEPDNNVIDGLLHGGAPLATFSLLNTAVIGDLVSFSGAGLVDFLNANSNADVAFIITTATINDQVFLGLGTSENAGNVPQLNYTVVPEPTSMTLAFLGGLGLFALRRRKV
jgi:hypothetical protein